MQTGTLRNGLSLAALTLSLTLALPAQAALQDEHNGQLYDNVTGLVWLQDANLAKTNTFGVSGIASDGSMNWSTANSWITAMNDANYKGYNDWMLPTVSPVNGSSFNYYYSATGAADVGYNITSQASQLSYMYYQNLGLKGAVSPSDAIQPDFGVFGNGTYRGQANVGLVNNLQSGVYWTGTAYAPFPSNDVWVFNTYDGKQQTFSLNFPFAVWGVRAGTAADIAAIASFAASVPEPESYATLLAGLGLIGLMARRRQTA
jgi:hypothetical protein